MPLPAADPRVVAGELLGGPAVMIGASLGGLSSMVAIARADDPVALGAALVLVDVAANIEIAGANRIGDFMRAAEGFASLEEVADAIAADNPHRPWPDQPARPGEERAPWPRRPVALALASSLHGQP